MTVPQRPEQSPPLVTLDILRAAAAMLVVLEHSRGLAFVTFTKLPVEQQTILVKAAYLASRLGQEAVMLFFVLSGYLVGGQVIRRAQQGRFNPRDFVIDRVSRIALPLLPAAIFAGLVGVYAHGVPFDALQVAGNVVGLNAVLVPTLPFNLPLWSLAYEIWFYAIAGAAAAIFTRRGTGIALAVAMTAMVVFCRLDASLIMVWMLGALVSAVDMRRGRGALACLGLVIVVLGSAAIQSARPSHASIHVSTMTVSMARSIFAAGFVMMVPWLTSDGLNRALARHGWLARSAALFAGMSYSLYLFHYPALNVIDRWFVPGPLSVAGFGQSLAGLALLLGFATIMYWLFERNTDRVRGYLKAWFARADAAATGQATVHPLPLAPDNDGATALPGARYGTAD